MNCPTCRAELETEATSCPDCGARIAVARESASAVRDREDWRAQVRETVARHKAKKRQEEEESREDVARQLSIFPDDSFEDEEGRVARQRRAEIRARVEERAQKRKPFSSGRLVDAGDLPLGPLSQTGPATPPSPPRTRSAVAAARDLSSLPVHETDREPGEERLERQDPMDLDPSTKELPPVSVRHYNDLRDLPMEPMEEGEPEEHVEPLVADSLASGLERVFAGFLDLAFVTLIQLGLFYLTAQLAHQQLETLPQSALVSMGVVGAVMGAGYFVFFWALSGQTLGKLLTGARVVDRSGRALGFGRAGLRLFGLLVAALPLGAGFLGLWTDAERRGWHDRIAGTKVIRG